jgi:hypothetical protein
MSIKRTFPNQLSLRFAFGLGILCTLGLIGYGKLLIPATSDLSIAAAVLVVVIYAIITWIASRRIEEKWPTILGASAPFGILAGFIFVSEVLFEYISVPANNTQLGYVEFGLVMFVYALVGALAANRYGSIGAGTIAAATAAIVSSLIWFIAVLAVFYWFRGSLRQELVFRAEGNYDDFARSGMANFDAFMMDDFCGAGFYHLLIGPAVAAILGTVAGCIMKTSRIVRRS